LVEGQWIRPERDDDWKSFFSAEIEKKTATYPLDGNTTKRYKTKKPNPDFNPFHLAGKTDRDIGEEVNCLLAVMEHSRTKLSTDRRHNDPPVRALVVTTATWNYASKSKRRDFLSIACWAVLESYWAKGYRRSFFEHVQIARIIRQDLSRLYQPFVISNQMILTPEGGIEPSTNFPWFDMLAPTESADDNTVAISIKEVEMETHVNKMSEKYNKEILKIISTVKSSATAHNNLGGAHTVDSVVRKHLRWLVRVSSFVAVCLG